MVAPIAVCWMFRIWNQCENVMPHRLRLAILLCLTVATRSADAADKPNVLFIAIDDLNDWVGALGGNPQAVTPNLDRLANEGVVFTNAHCAAPACNPSRAALMTGVRPSTSGVYMNPNIWRKSPMLADAVTLPQHFMKSGYSAKGSGKIYHGRFPDPPSWQEYWPSQTENKPVDPKPRTRPANGIPKTGNFDWGSLPNSNEEMGDWQVASWIAEQLRQPASGTPFFLACGFYRPHLPWHVPQEYFDKFPLDSIVVPTVPADDLDDIPAAGIRMANPKKDHASVTKHDKWKQAVQAYLACSNFTDTCLGRVLDALDASPHRDNTIVVLWSDHGWHLGEKQHWRKFALWEEATQVVMIWYVPGVTNPGGRCKAPVNLLDIYPTLVDLCELPHNDRLEGTSLRPLLQNPLSMWNQPTITTHGLNNHAVRSERYRYIRYADGSEELYDHANDEMEFNNLIGKQGYDQIKNDLAKWLPETNVPETVSFE